MNDGPTPLSPPDCDLRDYTWMPLDVVRLLDSDLFALSTGDEFKAAVALWCKAWSQLPAGSLPSDERVLAHLSGAGTRWSRVRGMALRGWILCSDGRFYHPVVSGKATEAWTLKLAQKSRTAAARAAKQQRSQSGNSGSGSGPPPPVTISVTEIVTTPVTETVTTPVTQTVTGSTRPDQTVPDLSSLRSDNSVSLRSTGTAVAVAEAVGVVERDSPDDPDPRTRLFRDGLALLVRLTGQAEPRARTQIGRWLKLANDDAALVLLVLHDAADHRPASAIPWIERALQARAGPVLGQPQRPLPESRATRMRRELGLNLTDDQVVTDENQPRLACH